MIVPKPLTLILLVFFLFFTLPAVAQQQISGTQSGTLGPGTYEVIGNIQVLANQTLTILPGTDFLHTGNYSWSISGRLIADGTVTDSIRFIRKDPISTHIWSGIRFNSTANHGSFDYCVIKDCRSNGIYSNSVNLSVTNTRISNCIAQSDGGGINAYHANVTVTNCVITHNTAASYNDGGGIYLNACNEVTIRNSIIAYNSATGT